jgi:galactokinase
MREAQATAPGRVNLIGEHTDYHDGYVMPSAVPQHTTATVTPRQDTNVVVSSNCMPDVVEYELGRERRRGHWSDYVQGVTWVLAKSGFPPQGCEVHLESNVPLGSGLSSSAALLVALLKALRFALEATIDDVRIARMAQRAEVEFVGAPVGIMDQMACSLATERGALFLDTRSLSFERIEFPAALELAVIDSGIAHQHAGGDYVTRRQESEEAARWLGVDKLRDTSVDALDRMGEMPDLLARRARHVITENARVLRARDALQRGDLDALGELFSASHASLRDDYQVSIPEVDVLVAAADAQPGVYGARMTGGGFGGAIVVATQTGRAREAAQAACIAYTTRTGREARVLVPAQD